MKKKHHILIIAHSESVHTVRFANEFYKRGFEVSVLSSSPYLGRVVKYNSGIGHIAFGGRITNVFGVLFKNKIKQFNPENSPAFHPFNFLVLFRMIYLFLLINKVLKGLDFHAVFCTNLTTNGILVARINKKVPKVCQTLGCDLKLAKWNSANILTNNKIVYRFVESKLDYIITGDEIYYDNFFSDRTIFKYPEKIIKFRGLGVDTDLFNPRFKNDKLKKELYGLHAEDILAVCFRQPRPQFSLPQILQTLKEVIKEYPNFYFAIGTGGLEFPVLKKMAKENGMEKNILFMPNISYEKLHFYISQADIYIDPINLKINPELASLGISGSVLESMAAGLIPVIMNRPGLKSYFNSELKELIYEDMDTDLETYILNAIKRKKDLKLKDNLREIVVIYSSWGKNIGQISSLFTKK